MDGAALLEGFSDKELEDTLGNPIGTASWPSGRTPGTGLWRAQKICKGVNFFGGKNLECASALISALARLYNRASAHISALTPSNFLGEI